jgi:hypothetical protein
VRKLILAAFIVYAGVPLSAAEWVNAGHLSNERLNELCSRASGLTMLARTQIGLSHNGEWRRLARQMLEVESFTMGTSPLDPSKCYVIARAGQKTTFEGDIRRRAFEVRDFSQSSDRTLVMVVGTHFPLEPSADP